MKSNPKYEVAVSAEEVMELREVLGALTIKEIAQVLHASRASFYAWMRDGIPAKNRAAVMNYNTVADYIDSHGAQALMEGRIVPMESTIEKVSRRCLAMDEKDGKYIRCRGRKVVGRDFCRRHVTIYESNNAVVTVDGRIAHKRDRGRILLPRRCPAVADGGYRCSFTSIEPHGLCVRHYKQLKKHGELAVLDDGIVKILHLKDVDAQAKESDRG